MPAKFNPFPDPKKGKGRMVIKRPASQKTVAWKKVKHVRGKRSVPPSGVRREQARWKRTVPHLLKCTDAEIVQVLIDDGVLPDWSSKLCPKCNQGVLSPLKWHSGDSSAKYRCSRKACHQRFHPHYLHPLFQAGRGPEALSPQIQASLLLLLLLRVAQASIHLILGVNQKVIENMQRRLEEVQKKYVEKWEKKIQFGKTSAWCDVEGDEATFDKRDVAQDPDCQPHIEDNQSVVNGWGCFSVEGLKPWS